jgi:DNA-binding transcriptional LysR family regulator
VSIATVKRRLARLEDLIGAKLYSGYQRTFVLTEEGHQLAETLYRVDGLLSHAKPDLAMPTQNDKTKVSNWLMDVLFEMFLLPFYKANVELSRTYQISTTSGEMPELSQRFSNDITIAHYASANVAAVHSMDSAALALGISGPTVKRRIDQLEASLNAKLFHGQGAGFRLTKYGQFISGILE